VRGLTLIVATAEAPRFRAALRLAAAAAALGRPVRMFLDEEAVPATADIAAAPLLSTALELGVAITLCQTGLAGAGLDLSVLDDRLEAGGLVSLLQALADDQLVTV
jgi:predicted peroxiredoxin